MFFVHDIIAEGTKDMRDVFCETMLDLAEKDPKICMLDADLMGAMGTKRFAQTYPERTIDCGIQEANMFGVAAGLSSVGMVPFAHTFAVFSSRRALDQIYLSCAYAGQNVKIIGSDCGINAALNGGTHMAIDDLGIFRAIPNMTVLEPTDNVMLKELLPYAAKTEGCIYLRLVRKTCPDIYKEGSTFQVGKANVLREGSDAAVIACGFGVSCALKAADRLEKEGIHITVIDCFTIKPLDREAIVAAAEKTGNIITIENHSITNGLGSAVAEVLCEEAPAKLTRLGFQNCFGQVALRDELAEIFGITEEKVYCTVKESLVNKK